MTIPSGLPPASPRRRPRCPAAALAIALAAAVAAVGLLPAAAAAGVDATAADAAPASGPTLTVSKTSGFDPNGAETVTVTGTGFTDTATGTRPPLAGQPAGVYVVFGRYAETWRPSEGAPSSSRQSISQKWALPASSRTMLDPGGTQSDYVTIDESGRFTAELEVRTAEGSGDYAVVTYPGSGGQKAEHELHVPMSFAGGDTEADPAPAPAPGTEPEPAPVDGPGGSRTATGPQGQELTVTPADDLDPEGQQVNVRGSGYDPAVGVYVALCVDNGPGQVPSPCVGGADQSGESGSSAFISSDPKFAGLATPWGPGGTFDVDLTITAADDSVDCLDGTVTCKVVTRADHTASSDRSADVKVPVHWTGQAPLAPEQDEPQPTPVHLDRSHVRVGDGLVVRGEGFLPGEQVQIWVHSDPRLLDVVEADGEGAVAATVTIPIDLEPGVHHIEMRGVTSGHMVRSAPFTVLAQDAAGSPTAAVRAATATGTLPRTGAGRTGLALGSALLAAAAATTTIARRAGQEVTR
jgi:hypothetical protein